MNIANIYATLNKHTKQYDKETRQHSFKESRVARLCHAALIPLDIGNDLLSGVRAFPLACVSLVLCKGRSVDINNDTNRLLDRFGSIFAHTFRHTLSCINPSAFSQDPANKNIVEFDRHNGVVSEFAMRKVYRLFQSFKDSPSFTLREVVSRCLVTLRLSIVAARVVDLSIAILAVPLAFVSRGTIKNINNLAYRSLLLPKAAQDIYWIALFILNPYRL